MSIAGAIRAGGAFVEIFARDGRFQQAMARVRATLRATAAAMRRMGSQMTIGATAIGLPIIAGIRQAAKYEDAILGMSAAAGLTAEQVDVLEKEIQRLSVAMGVDPTNIANAFLELAKAGMSVEDILAGAGRSAVEFARVSGVDMAEAAVFMKVAMNTFGVSATEAVDTLSAAADASETSISELVQAFALVGSAGVSFDQTLFDLSQGLAALARFGISSEEAGTGIKTMLMRLVSPADTAQEAMAQIGLAMGSFRDADGNLLPLVQIIEILSQALEGVDKQVRDQVLGDIFGDRAIRIVGAFLEMGVDGFGDLARQMQGNLPVAQKFQILMSGITGTMQRLYAAAQRLAVAFAVAAGPSMSALATGLLFLIETVAELARQFPAVAGAFVTTLASMFALGVAAIVGGMALFVLERAVGVLTSAITFLLSPLVLAGRAITFLALQFVAATPIIAAAAARVALAVARMAAAIMVSLASLVLRLAVVYAYLAFLAASLAVSLAVTVATGFASLAAAAAARMPVVAALVADVARALAVSASVMVFHLNRVTFGFFRVAAAATVSMAIAAARFAVSAVIMAASMFPYIAAVAAGAAATFVLYYAAVAVVNGIAALAAGIWQFGVGVAQSLQAAATSAMDSARAMAVSWGQQLNWMWKHLQAQNYSAVWKALEIDFKIAMLQMANAANVGLRAVQRAFLQAYNYIYDSFFGGLERAMLRLESMARTFVAVLSMSAALLEALATGAEITPEGVEATATGRALGLSEQMDALDDVDRRRREARTSAAERAEGRQAQLDAFDAETAAASADFAAGIDALRGDLADLLEQEPPEGDKVPDKLDINPAEFRDPRLGIGDKLPGQGEGIGQTLGGFGGDASGLGIGPELNTVSSNTARTADGVERVEGILGEMQGGIGGLAAADGGRGLFEQAMSQPGATQPRWNDNQIAMEAAAVRASARDGLRQAAQTAELHETARTGLSAVVAAIRAQTDVQLGQSGQLGAIAAGVAQMKGALV